MIPFGNFHNVDYNLVYMNLRENAADCGAFRGVLGIAADVTIEVSVR